MTHIPSKAALTSRELALLSLLTAILMVGKVAMEALPNIELVSLLIAIYTLSLGKKALAVIYVFVLLEGLIFGFGLWFINYLYIWLILWCVVMLLRHMTSPIGWALVLSLFGLCFGLLCAIPYVFIGGFGMAASYFVSGIPFDLLHCAGNLAVGLILFKPLDALMRRGMRSMGLPSAR